MKKILVKHKINNKDIKGKQYDVYLYNETDDLDSESSEILLQKGQNCSSYRVESSWATWEHDARLVEGFNKRFPKALKIGVYDFSLAIIKAVYWSHFKSGQLEYAKQFYPNSQFIEPETWLRVSKLKTLVKYLRLFFNFKKSTPSPIIKVQDFKVGILIKTLFQVSLYKHVIRELKEDSASCFFAYTPQIKQAIMELGIEENRILILPSITNHLIPFVNIFKLKKTDWYVLNQLIGNWQQVCQIREMAEFIIGFGVKKILINEAENGLVGAAYCEVFKRHDVIIYNAMNGAKAGEAQDAYINFDYWFVWDNKMKDLLIKKNKLPENKLIVTGHLMEDEIRDYQYKNTIPFSKKDLEEKKVISLFSVRGNREEKIEAFKYLYTLLSQREDLILLVRKHPSESVSGTLLPNQKLSNVYWIEYTPASSKTTLYDQLSISDISVCFGSTVALESKWFGVPCISFEKTEESLIYAVDKEKIFHVKNIEKFKFLIGGYLVKSKLNRNNIANNFPSTASNILTELQAI